MLAIIIFNPITHTHTYLHKCIKDPSLPVGVVLLEAGRLPCVGRGHQTLHLDQQGAYGMVLPTKRAKDVTTMCLLELKVLLKDSQR